eukprot:jgi/Chlat1/7227/Chrsp57S00538
MDQVMRLSVEQLQAAREQGAAEASFLAENAAALRAAAARFEAGSVALTDLARQDDNAAAAALVPLSPSLYVPAKLADTRSVLVDVGTGYFVQLLNQKRQQQEVVTLALQAKMRAAPATTAS